MADHFHTALVLMSTACQEKAVHFKAEYRDLTEAIYSTVTVEPRTSYQVYAPVTGIIVDSELKTGETVKRGDRLFRIKNPQMGCTTANARLNYEIAKVYLETQRAQSSE